MFSLSSAATDVHGDTIVTINSGTILDGTDTTPSSSFSSEILSLGDETVTSSALQLSTVTVDTIDGDTYFAFVYDAQETQQARELRITELSLYVDVVDTGLDLGTADLIWDLAETIVLNPGGGSPQTNSPLGAGGDMAMFVPVSLFAGYSTNDYLYFQTTQTDSNNGNDEWVLTGVPYLPPDTIITPEPTSALLLLLAGVLFTLVRRPRRPVTAS